MKRVNLLPQHLLEAQAQRRQRAIYRLVLCGILVTTTVWTGVAAVHVHYLNRRITAAKLDLAPVREQAKHIDQTQQEHQQLIHRYSTIKALRDPLSPAAIIALLTQLMPDGVVVDRLDIEAPSLVWASDINQPQTANPYSHDNALIRIVIEGTASTDLAVPMLIGQLTKQKLFQNVRLGKSQEVIINDTRRQGFHIMAEIFLPNANEDRIADARGGRS